MRSTSVSCFRESRGGVFNDRELGRGRCLGNLQHREKVARIKCGKTRMKRQRSLL